MTVTDACTFSTHAHQEHGPHRWWDSDDTAHNKGYRCDGQVPARADREDRT